MGVLQFRELWVSWNPTAWLQTMEHQGLRTVAILGSVKALDEFAAKHGKRWVHGKGHARKLRK